MWKIPYGMIRSVRGGPAAWSPVVRTEAEQVLEFARYVESMARQREKHSNIFCEERYVSRIDYTLVYREGADLTGTIRVN